MDAQRHPQACQRIRCQKVLYQKAPDQKMRNKNMKEPRTRRLVTAAGKLAVKTPAFPTK